MAVAARATPGFSIFTLGHILVRLLPETRIIDQVHVVRPFQGIGRQSAGGMACSALDDRPRMALQL